MDFDYQSIDFDYWSNKWLQVLHVHEEEFCLIPMGGQVRESGWCGERVQLREREIVSLTVSLSLTCRPCFFPPHNPFALSPQIPFLLFNRSRSVLSLSLSPSLSLSRQMPVLPQRVIGFGGSAVLVHPATGYFDHYLTII